MIRSYRFAISIHVHYSSEVSIYFKADPYRKEILTVAFSLVAEDQLTVITSERQEYTILYKSFREAGEVMELKVSRVPLHLLNGAKDLVISFDDESDRLLSGIRFLYDRDTGVEIWKDLEDFLS